MTESALTLERLLNDASLRNTLYQWVSDPADADDVLQQVAEKAVRERIPVHSKGYLSAVLRNSAIDLSRANRRRETNTRGLACRYENSFAPAPEKNLQASQAITAIQAVIDRHPPLSRKIFMLYHVQGVTQPEIARCLGIHLSTVEKRLAKIRKACLKELEAHLD